MTTTTVAAQEESIRPIQIVRTTTQTFIHSLRTQDKILSQGRILFRDKTHFLISPPEDSTLAMGTLITDSPTMECRTSIPGECHDLPFLSIRFNRRLLRILTEPSVTVSLRTAGNFLGNHSTVLCLFLSVT